MKKNYQRLNIVFQPPEDVIEKVIFFSEKLGNKHDAYFTIDGINYYPHITIYSPEYPDKNLDTIIEKLKILSLVKSQDFMFQFKTIKANQGYVTIEFNLTNEIKVFHEEVVEIFNPLREGHIRKKLQAADYRMTLTKEKIKNIAKYGYPSAMALYKPHMTIIRLKDEELAQKAVKDVKWDINKFVVNEIAIYKMSEHGTCTEILKGFKLGSR